MEPHNRRGPFKRTCGTPEPRQPQRNMPIKAEVKTAGLGGSPPEQMPPGDRRRVGGDGRWNKSLSLRVLEARQAVPPGAPKGY
jgi:hypothetical protein